MTCNIGNTQSFFKVQGSGNDFIIIDNRQLKLSVDQMPGWAKNLCPRAFSIGADGLIFLEESPRPDEAYRWHFYNADGSRAEMCGNGSRCAALIAYQLGLAGLEHTFGSDAGPIKAHVFPENLTVNVQLTPVKEMRLDLSLDIGQGEQEILFANTGVPHAVIICKDLDNVDIPKSGSAVRYHDFFSPSGTNANFTQIIDADNIRLRTYERGVEAETFACGTGAAATVAVLNAKGLVSNKVAVTTTGGEVLEISLHDGSVFLCGKATPIYSGQFYKDNFSI